MQTSSSTPWVITSSIVILLLTCLGSMTAAWTDPAPHTFLTISYYLVCYVGQYALFTAVLGLMLYVVSRVCRTPLLFLPINMLLASGFVFFFVMNSLVYSIWRYNINGVLIGLGFGPGSSQVMSTGNATFYLVGGIGVACFLVTSITLWITWRYRACLRNRLIQATQVIAFIVYLLSQIATIGLSLTGNMRLLPYSDKVPYFNVLSLYNAMDHLGIPLTNTHNNTLMALKANLSSPSLNNYPTEPLHYQSTQQPPLNVLIILVDTWRTDMLSPKFMPYTAAFSEQSDQFLNHISGGNCTAPGVFSLFYGLPAVYWNSATSHHITPVMLQAFKDNHYQFAFHVSAPITEPPFEDNVFTDFPKLAKETQGNTVLDRDTRITQDMITFLKQQQPGNQPFFGFMFYDALHSYSAAPQLTSPNAPSSAINYFTLTNHTNPTPFFNRYKNAAYYDDKLIHQVLTTLKQQHLLNNTVVILSGDHGQEYNEFHKSYWEHGDNYAHWQHTHR